jgi:hypothetical protein
VLVAVIAAIKRIPLEAVVVANHHAQHFAETFFGNVEGIVDKRNRIDSPELANRIQLMLDMVHTQVLVLAGALRKTAKSAGKRA